MREKRIYQIDEREIRDERGQRRVDGTDETEIVGRWLAGYLDRQRDTRECGNILCASAADLIPRLSSQSVFPEPELFPSVRAKPCESRAWWSECERAHVRTDTAAQVTDRPTRRKDFENVSDHLCITKRINAKAIVMQCICDITIHYEYRLQ